MIGKASLTLAHFFMPVILHRSVLGAVILCILAGVLASAQTKKAPPPDSGDEVRRGLDLAKQGDCKGSLPLLRRGLPHIANKELKREVGFAGVRCGIFADQPEVAGDFLHFLNHEFPHDPDVLYLSVHTYSDLSTRAAAELARSAPNSDQAQELNAEALEVQQKWDEAEKIYRRILKHNSNLAGIHYRLGRVLVSKPEFGPTVAEGAKQEFEKELQVDPSNAGAEYVLGEMAKQKEQWNEAVEHFSRAAKLDVAFGDAFLGWGGALISMKKYTEAITPLETAVKLQDGNPAAHYLLGTAYSRTGRKEDSDREFAIQRQLTQKGAAGEPSPRSQQTPN